MPTNASVHAAVACQTITSITSGREQAAYNAVADIERASGYWTIQLHRPLEAAITLGSCLKELTNSDVATTTFGWLKEWLTRLRPY